MSKRVLVTGGAGFIGSHVCEALVARGDRVRVLDDFSSSTRANLAAIEQRIEVIEGTITSRSTVTDAMHDCTHVVHLAARSSVHESLTHQKLYREVNTEGTASIIDCARRANVQRIVFASSCSMYGAQSAPQHEEMTATPLSPYAATKLEGEEQLRAMRASCPTDAAVLRFFNIYGARQDPKSAYAAVISRFFDALRSGNPITIYGDGEQTRDFTCVADAADAIMRALDCATPLGALPINVGTGVATSVNTLAAVIARSLRTDAHIRREPARDGEVRQSVATTTRARELLGFAARVDLATGIESMAKLA